MVFATKKELLWIGIITLVFIAIIYLLVIALPLKVDTKNQKDINKDINNFNPAYDGNSINAINQLAIDQNNANLECVSMCKQYYDPTAYKNGPCLSDQYGFKTDDWVCDISHNPRIAVDDDSKNKCKSFINNEANHFVEVDENCNILRSY